MRFVLALTGAALLHASAYSACPPAGTTRAQLAELRAARWEVADPAQRQALALGMLGCLADPDPALRDEAGFESLQFMLRGQKLDTATMQTIRAALLGRLRQDDARGFTRPFAALTLAEIVRADRVKPFMSDAERAEVFAASTAYLASVRDYRGFDEKDGWRHGVAHGADLMLQLSVHPALGKPEQQAILAAVATQLTAPGKQEHFYRYGEGERLMAPVFYLARRSEIDAAAWEAWFAALTVPPGPFTQASLARRHNLKGFLQPLYVSLAESKDADQRARLLPLVVKALRQLE
ncbi:DUF2785 domain-containing protein [Janthinobacterium sp.]|uniref:DUF2785 domain-containing protein n=1 Tax=Janthinobacterium sp. TaxID=1871054 RepID=UPI002DBF4F01|nr:DUF2785 domain-containing protein [Janthinobacterium sp.]HEU4815896.1 DUF2785 domain-containing protein [Janthinobacterium sp.]